MASKKLSAIDLEFHKMLARSSHNQLCILMTDVVSSLCIHMFWDATCKMPEDEVFRINQLAYESHAQIAEAVIARDAVTLVRVMNNTSDLFYDAVTSL